MKQLFYVLGTIALFIIISYTPGTSQGVQGQRGSVAISTFPDNEPINVAQMNGVTVLMGAGNTGTGSQRVTEATDSQLSAGVGATGDAAATAGSTGSLNAKVRLLTTDLDAVKTSVQLIDDTVKAAAAAPDKYISIGGLGSGATGGQIQPVRICDTPVNINTAASAQVVTGVSGRKIYVCAYNVQMNGGANTISFVSGTGTTCATGTTAIQGLDGATSAANGYSFAANSGIANASLTPLAVTANTGDNLCILLGSATRVAGGMMVTIQ